MKRSLTPCGQGSRSSLTASQEENDSAAPKQSRALNSGKPIFRMMLKFIFTWSFLLEETGGIQPPVSVGCTILPVGNGADGNKKCFSL